MPREQITYERLRATSCSVTPDEAGGPPIVEETECFNSPTLHVCWFNSKEGGGWVQTMYRVRRGYLEDLLSGTEDDEIELFSEVLDRSECNKLIRSGRRARDAAYGRDE